MGGAGEEGKGAQDCLEAAQDWGQLSLAWGSGPHLVGEPMLTSGRSEVVP